MSSQEDPANLNSLEMHFRARSNSFRNGSLAAGENGEVIKKADDPSVITSSRIRFWIVGLFTYSAFLTIAIWATFGPIVESAEYAFGWDDGYVAFLDGIGTITSVLSMVPLNWISQKYGLRVAMLISSTLILLSSGIRCISIHDTAFTYLAGLGAGLNGAASALTLSLPAMVASTWFPSHERATATAVCESANVLGMAGGYLSPLIVRRPDGTLSKDDIKGDIRLLMFITFGLSAVGWICILIYYPKKPKHPPSISSTQERINYYEGVKTIIRNPQVICLVMIYAVIYAIPISWIAVMNFSFMCLDVSQDDSMWIGITACIGAAIVGICVARITDRFYGHLKLTIIGLLAFSSCCFLWFLLITEKVIIISSIAQPFVAVVLGESILYASIPLLIEMAVEMAYPCPESVVGAFLSIVMDSTTTTFLLLMMINSNCYRWLSYALLLSTSVTILPLSLLEEKHTRNEMDTKSPGGSAPRQISSGKE